MGSIGFTVSGDWPKLAVNLKVKNTYFPLACSAMCLFKPFFFGVSCQVSEISAVEMSAILCLYTGIRGHTQIDQYYRFTAKVIL